MSHIFVSYSHTDKAYAHSLAHYLEEQGFEVWIDDRIDYGVQWPHVIQTKVDSCSALIVIMTPHSYQSEWVQSELSRAKRKQKAIFPLLLEGEEPWLSVESTQMVDVRGKKLPPPKLIVRLAQVAPRALRSERAASTQNRKMTTDQKNRLLTRTLIVSGLLGALIMLCLVGSILGMFNIRLPSPVSPTITLTALSQRQEHTLTATLLSTNTPSQSIISPTVNEPTRGYTATPSVIPVTPTETDTPLPTETDILLPTTTDIPSPTETPTETESPTIERVTDTPTGLPQFGSQENPVPIGDTLKIIEDNTYEYTVSVKTVYRGNEAMQKLMAANQYNKPASTGTEFLLTYVIINFTKGTIPSKLIILESNFTTYSQGYFIDLPEAAVPPDPNIIYAELRPTDKLEGWLALQIYSGEKYPVIVFGDSLHNDDRLYFAAYPRKATGKTYTVHIPLSFRIKPNG